MITDLDFHHQPTKIKLSWFCELLHIHKERVINEEEVFEWVEKTKRNEYEFDPNYTDGHSPRGKIDPSYYVDEVMEQSDWVDFVKEKYYL